ncbi:hypothetical protein [Micromonospora sp. NPDC005324]|uniref:hypothetical protein n=1 Tax=Micromonospora sp. NPDC005324 TaxID=3157033 RepID=UPI0033B33598
MNEVDLTRYRYTSADLESLPPSRLRAGDLLASAGPPGTARHAADRVIAVDWAGWSRFWGADTWRVRYRSPWGEQEFVNPDTMHVHRVRRDVT